MTGSGGEPFLAQTLLLSTCTCLAHPGTDVGRNRHQNMEEDPGKAHLDVAGILECVYVKIFIPCLNTKRFRAVDTKRDK